MKTLAVYFPLVSAVSLAFAADSSSITGKWQIHNAISGHESDQVCTFTQKETNLAGSCTSERGTVEISGEVDGTKISWSYKSEYNGTPLTVVYEGTLDGARITGSVSVPEFQAQGDFAATQPR